MQVSWARARVYRAQVGGRLKFEEDLFIRRMEKDRGWSATTAYNVWKSHLDNTDTPRDNGGFDGALRLYLPSNLFAGVDMSEERRGSLEKKSLVNQSKSVKNVEQEVQQQYLEETQLGFQRPPLSADLANKMHNSAPPSGLTAYGSGQEAERASARSTLLQAGMRACQRSGDAGGCVVLLSLACIIHGGIHLYVPALASPLPCWSCVASRAHAHTSTI